MSAPPRKTLPRVRRGPAFLRLPGAPGLVALVVLAGCGAAPRPSVLLVTLDTLRADHLGAYGSTTTRTPAIDRLAAESTLFENAAAPMPLTRPSHFSILTSRYPREHGVVNNRTSLPESELTLPEILAEHGYRTAGFVAVKLLDARSGASQGFETFDAPANKTKRSAEEVVGRTLAWISVLEPRERFFVWMHAFDPHLPYEPPAEFRRDLDPDLDAEYPSVDWRELYQIAARHGKEIPARHFEYVKGLYRGDVEYTDHWVGRLIEGLGDRLDETLLVLTADHGESFEHGVYFEHSDCLYDGAIRIPLIVRYPAAFPAGARVATQTSNIDVAPTVLDVLGLPVPASYSGRSLVGLGEDPGRYVLIQHPIYQPGAAENRTEKSGRILRVAGEPRTDVLVDAERVGLLGTDWKLVRTGEELELFPFAPVRDESRDVSAEHADALERLRSRLDAELERHPLHIVEEDLINQEALEVLRELGYVDVE